MRKIDLHNEQLPLTDKELYEKMQGNFVSEKEKEFFEQMICKEIYDYPVSTFDVFVHEDSNDERIFIQKMYISEYEIGKYREDGSYTLHYDQPFPLCLAELLDTDLFPLLDRHLTVLAWLREKNYECVRYDFPWED